MSNIIYTNSSNVIETGSTIVFTVEGDDWNNDKQEWGAIIGGESAIIDSVTIGTNKTDVTISTPDITSLNAGLITMELHASKENNPGIPIAIGSISLIVTES